MKKQKMVSLDDETAQISQTMGNFSKWVRVGLRNHANGIDATTQLMDETALRVRWVKVSRLLAEAMLAKYIEHDPKYKGTVDELIGRAIAECNKQKSLEEFE
jgi:hypothetical protein